MDAMAKAASVAVTMAKAVMTAGMTSATMDGMAMTVTEEARMASVVVTSGEEPTKRLGVPCSWMW